MYQLDNINFINNDNNINKNNKNIDDSIKSNNSNFKSFINKYNKEIKLLLFVIIVFFISNFVFNIFYPEINDSLFITKLINGFRNFLKKYQILWFFVLFIGLLLLNDIQQRNLNFLTKNIIIIIIFCFILFFPFYPYTTYYNIYVSLVHYNIKSIYSFISNKFK